MTTEYPFEPKSNEAARAVQRQINQRTREARADRDAEAQEAFIQRAVARRLANDLELKVKKPTSPNNASGKVITPKNIKTRPPKNPSNDYKWNLPPHRWSMPVKPTTVQKELYEGIEGYTPDETYRRGRIWWYFNANTDYSDAGALIKQKVGAERKYGFQFMWNPESYSTSVQLNTEITPHPTDRFAGVAGLFPSGESISFTLRLDRTNDFYCFRHLIKKQYGLGAFQSAGGEQAYENAMGDFYTGSFFSNGSIRMGKKIKDLMELGTIADLEYLFVAVNGPQWKNIIGRPTGDIGFLSATLLRVDIGPSSYVGYINSLNVNHIAFSQDMTPIRTDVQISMNLMASAGLADAGTAAAIAPTKKGK
jgi:hypothetical protein